MKLLLAQLSDIHLSQPEPPPPADKVAHAIVSVNPAAEACFVALTGDIAYSGKAEEYAAAVVYLQAVKDTLATELGANNVHFLAIPGNHDCDFSLESAKRTAVTDGPLTALVEDGPSSEELEECIQVQAGFWNFYDNWIGDDSAGRRIAWAKTFNLAERIVRFNCLNTSWLSTIHEKPGRLYVPEASLPSLDAEPCDLAVVLMHHPYNWLAPTNARATRDRLELTADLVLTGHEHVPGNYKKSGGDGSRVEYIEGSILGGAEAKPNAGFNVLSLDLGARSSRVVSFRWDGTIFTRHRDGPNTPITRNPLVPGRVLEWTTDFRDFVEDLGTGFTHPMRPNGLRLDDLFLAPDLDVRDSVLSLEKARRVRSSDAINFLSNTRSHLIVGADQSGKTTLAKKLLVHLHDRQGLLPIYCNGESLRGLDEQKFLDSIEAAVEDQYGASAGERFRQSPRLARVLVLDDFQKLPYNLNGQRKLIAVAERVFGRILVLANDVLRFLELTESGQGPKPLSEYSQCEIVELGYRLRGQLIERWFALGQEAEIDAQEVALSVRRSEAVVDALLGRNLLPSFPFTVLTILQTQEAAREPNVTVGSYGYLYEALIKSAMVRALEGRSNELDIYYTLIARLAYRLFRARRRTFSLEDLSAVLNAYFLEFRVRVEPAEFVGVLDRSRLVAKRGRDACFRYSYIYYYFVASYLKDGIAGGDAECAEDRDRIADRIHSDEYSSIVVFYLYLTRDIKLIERLLGNAKEVFSEYPEALLAEDVAFLDDLSRSHRIAALPSGDASEHRERYREDLDVARDKRGPERSETEGEAIDVVYSAEINDVARLNIALKTIFVLGQVLRNFPGSLRGTLKHEIALACYRLGLRTLEVVISTGRENLEKFREYLEKMMEDRFAAVGEERLEDAASGMLLWLFTACTHGLIKRVSGAVGLEQLKQTYDDLLGAEGAKVSVKLIDLSIRLDHFSGVPEARISGLRDDLEDRHFAKRVLCSLVREYFYLFPVPGDVRQRVGAVLSLQATNVRYLDNPDRRLPPGRET